MQGINLGWYLELGSGEADDGKRDGDVKTPLKNLYSHDEIRFLKTVDCERLAVNSRMGATGWPRAGCTTKIHS